MSGSLSLNVETFDFPEHAHVCVHVAVHMCLCVSVIWIMLKNLKCYQHCPAHANIHRKRT